MTIKDQILEIPMQIYHLQVKFLFPYIFKLGQSMENPKDENFCSMLKNSLCPRIRLISFTSLVILVITLLYILMLSLYGVNQESFLLVTIEALENFGGNYPYRVKYNGEIYLWFTSLFLSYDFLSYIQNIVFLLIICSPMEAYLGMVKTIIIYLLGGACGCLFGCVTQCCILNSAYGEVSTALYALYGGYLAMLIIQWQKLAVLGPVRSYLACIIVMMLLLLLLFSLGMNHLYSDNLGCLGGFLGGLFIGLCVIDVQQMGPYEKNCRYFGLGFLGLYVFLCIILLYTLSY